MARMYAKIHTDIWSDEEFKSLDRNLQHMYFVLLSQPRLGSSGLLDYFPRRLAQASHTLTVDEVERDVKGLEELRYVLVDRDTSELLIRTFMRNDGLFATPNLAVAAFTEYGGIMSQELRDALESEFVKCRLMWPNETTWDRLADINPVVVARILKRAG